MSFSVICSKWKLSRQWLDDVNLALSSAENLTVESMRQMIEKGISLPPHSSCESVLIHLQQLLSMSVAVDDKARQCLLSRYVKRFCCVMEVVGVIDQMYDIFCSHCIISTSLLCRYIQL